MSRVDPEPVQRAPDARAALGSPGLPTSSVPSVRPERPRSCGGSLAAALGVAVGAVYLLNPTAGMLELIPDVVPGFGNLDEAGAAALLIFGLRYLLARRR